MPATIADVIRGRARVMDMSQSLQADVRYQGVIGTITSRVQGVMNQVRARTGMGTRTAATGGSGTIQDRINAVRNKLRGAATGDATQRVGAGQSPAGEEFGAIR